MSRAIFREGLLPHVGDTEVVGDFVDEAIDELAVGALRITCVENYLAATHPDVRGIANSTGNIVTGKPIA